MKSRFHKLILSLLIAVMCANCVLPALAATEMSESEKKYFEDSVAASQKTFLQLYGQVWKDGNYDAKLAEAVNKGVDEKMNSMLPGTRSARMMMESNQKEALELVIKEFTPAYDMFLQDLQTRFGEINDHEMFIFYENLIEEAVAKNDDPEVKEKIRSAGDVDAHVLVLITNSLSKKHLGTYIKPDTVEIDISAPGFREQVNSLIAEKLGIGKTALAAATVAAMTPVTVAVMTAWGGIAALGSLWNAPDKLKASLKDKLSESFTTQQPAYYWEVMENDVRAILEVTYAVFQLKLEEATK